MYVHVYESVKEMRSDLILSSLMAYEKDLFYLCLCAVLIDV